MPARLRAPSRASSLRPRTRRSRGQSLVEFALIVPVILLVTMLAIDFGRVYLGYINLQNMSRIAANYAANNPTAWGTPGDLAVQAKYRNQILNDAKATNCTLPTSGGSPTVPAPTFANGTGLGSSATVGITCGFRIATPVISSIIGTAGVLNVSASSVFPIKSGMSATGGAGGGPSLPTALFDANRKNGPAPLAVQFTDQSLGNPTNWAWDFDGDLVVDSTLQNPTHTYTSAGSYTVTLTVGNAAGTSTETKPAFIGVGAPTGDVNFTASPVSGTSPLAVQFLDTSTATATAWEWDFDDDGTVDDTTQNPSHTYPVAGTYSVTLTITTDTGPLSKTVTDMISVATPLCIVPNFPGTSTSSAQSTWAAAGFTTQMDFKQGGTPWTILSQSITGGTSVACGSQIRVSKTNQP